MALEGAGGLLYATLFRHNAGNPGKKLCYPTKFREFAKIYCKTDRGGGGGIMFADKTPAPCGGWMMRQEETK